LAYSGPSSCPTTRGPTQLFASWDLSYQLTIGAAIATIAISVLIRDTPAKAANVRLPLAALRDDRASAIRASLLIAVPVLIAFAIGVGVTFGIPYIDPAAVWTIAGRCRTRIRPIR